MSNKVSEGHWSVPYFLILPTFLIYSWIVVKPIVTVFFLSFHKWNGIPTKAKQFVGLKNFTKLFENKIFLMSIGNTFLWVILILLATVGLGFVIAYLLSQKIKMRTLFQTVFFLPVLQSLTATAVIWRWIYQPGGALNKMISLFAGDEVVIGWLGETSLALPMLSVAHIWSQVGLSIVLFLTGLQTIDPGLYESAEIDGAGFWQRFVHVTVPCMVSTTATVVIMVMTGAAKSFDLIKATTDGGPMGATEILATYTYKVGMTQNKYGQGSAVAVFLLLIILPITVIYYRRQQSKEL